MKRFIVIMFAAGALSLVGSESDRRIIAQYEQRGRPLPAHLQRSKEVLSQRDQQRATAQRFAELKGQVPQSAQFVNRPYMAVESDSWSNYKNPITRFQEWHMGSPRVRADYEQRIRERNERLGTLPSRTAQSLRGGAQLYGEVAQPFVEEKISQGPSFGPYVEDVPAPVEETPAMRQQREYAQYARQRALTRDPYAYSPLRPLQVMHAGGEENYMRRLEEQARARERRKQGYYGMSTPETRRKERLGAYNKLPASPLHEQYMYTQDRYATPEKREAMREAYEMFKPGAPLAVEPVPSVQPVVQRPWYERWFTRSSVQQPVAKPMPYQRTPSLRAEEYTSAYAPDYPVQPAPQPAPKPTWQQRAQPYLESAKTLPGRTWSGIKSGSQNLYQQYLGTAE
jgi:hypothetical protein